MNERQSRLWWLWGVLAISAIGIYPAAAQQTTTRETTFEIISVEGNTLVVRGSQGTREHIVPDDFRFIVDGKPLSVHDLKPGMKGSATITTTTTTRPVYVTEVRSGEVMDASGASVIVRGEKGFQMYRAGRDREARHQDLPRWQARGPLGLAQGRPAERHHRDRRPAAGIDRTAGAGHVGEGPGGSASGRLCASGASFRGWLGKRRRDDGCRASSPRGRAPSNCCGTGHLAGRTFGDDLGDRWRRRIGLVGGLDRRACRARSDRGYRDAIDADGLSALS